MTETPSPVDDLRQKIREVIERMNTDPTRLAKQIGRSKDYIRDFLDGRKESLNAYTLRDIERVAEIEEGSLISALPIEPGEKLQPNFAEKRTADLRVIRATEWKMPVYATREMSTRTLYVSDKRADEIVCPHLMRQDDASYSIIMEGMSMFPAYEAGDYLFLSPMMGLRRGYDIVVFERRPVPGQRALDRPEPRQACVMRLSDFDEKVIRGTQFGVDGELVLDRQEWGGMIRIVGKYNKR